MMSVRPSMSINYSFQYGHDFAVFFLSTAIVVNLVRWVSRVDQCRVKMSAFFKCYREKSRKSITSFHMFKSISSDLLHCHLRTIGLDSLAHVRYISALVATTPTDIFMISRVSGTRTFSTQRRGVCKTMDLMGYFITLMWPQGLFLPFLQWLYCTDLGTVIRQDY